MKSNIKKSYVKKLFKFDRRKYNQGFYTRGYVLDWSKDWTLIQVVQEDIFFDGYEVFWNKTVRNWRPFDDNNRLVDRALKKQGYYPKHPGKIELSNLDSVLVTANRIFPLLVVHPERRNPKICYVGALAGLRKDTIELASIGTNAKMEKKLTSIKRSDITRISFDGFYEKALWAVLPNKTRANLNRYRKCHK